MRIVFLSGGARALALATENIRKVTKKLNVDLFTYVVDNQEVETTRFKRSQNTRSTPTQMVNSVPTVFAGVKEACLEEAMSSAW